MVVVDTRRDDIRTRAVQDLRRFEVVMEGHFDYGNGYHGRLYLNPHQLFRYPSTIWRVAQDLIDVLPPGVAEAVTEAAGGEQEPGEHPRERLAEEPGREARVGTDTDL